MSDAAGARTLLPIVGVHGTVVVPGDKSISHRALILSALAVGSSRIANLSPAEDVVSTRRCLVHCGVVINDDGRDTVVVRGEGRLRGPVGVLDCGNSGTTMRLLAGVLAAQPFHSTLDGDASLRRRPMQRVADPLGRMGAVITTTAGHAPVHITAVAGLRGISYDAPVASAQLKSAVLLAGLAAQGVTTVHEPTPTRDHTERMLEARGIRVLRDGGRIGVGAGTPAALDMRVPGDLSSAAFFLCLAAARPGWSMTCTGVGLNPGRTGVLDVLEAMGAGVALTDVDDEGGEPSGTVTVSGAALHGAHVAGALIPRMIDELPVLAVLATQARGRTEIRDAAELRVKESDRIALLAGGLRVLGATVEEHADGLVIEGPTPLRGTTLDAHGDHRLAMAWAVASALATGTTSLRGADAVRVSYPRFFADLATVAS